jgi:hypothetical protein
MIGANGTWLQSGEFLERPSGSAVFQTTWLQHHYVEHQQNKQIVQHTNSSLASRNTQSDQSTVTDQMRVEGWDEMEEGSSGSPISLLDRVEL